MSSPDRTHGKLLVNTRNDTCTRTTWLYSGSLHHPEFSSACASTSGSASYSGLLSTFEKVSVEAGRQRNEDGVPAPVRSFKHAGFDDLLLSEVVRQGFEAPTPIQAQALPVVMSVREGAGFGVEQEGEHNGGRGGGGAVALRGCAITLVSPKDCCVYFFARKLILLPALLSYVHERDSCRSFGS